jgi:hypothetical protein
LAGVAVQNADVEVIDEHDDVGAGEVLGQADVVQAAVVARGGAPQSRYEVTEAWVRPLDNITSYSTNVRGFPGADWFEVAAWLTFRGLDAPVELPLASLTDAAEDQERSDWFLGAPRESIGWLG